MPKFENMEPPKSTLRIEIDGYWTVYDMTQFLAHAQDLYNFSLFLHANYEEILSRSELFFHVGSLIPSKSLKRDFESLFSSLNHDISRQRSMNLVSFCADSDLLSKFVLRFLAGKDLQLKKIVMVLQGLLTWQG